MQTFSCPHCGAPPPPGYSPPTDRKFGYLCVYCRQQSVHGEDPAPAAQVPAIIIVQAPGEEHHHHHHDYNDFHQAAVTHAAVSNGISWVVWLVVVLVVSLGGAGTAFVRHSKFLSGLVWDGSEPLTCTGNDDIAVTGVKATFNAGSAISATGNCRVKCTDCNITAPTAIEASGNAQVTIINGTVRGTTTLADATGNARVTITGNVTASGATQQHGNARVSAPEPPPVATTAAPVAATAPATPAAAKPAPKAATPPVKKK